MTSRALATAARRLADQQSARIAAAAMPPFVRATVTTVTAGAASDGNALVHVTWRGQELVVADYPDSYTPAVGHRVLCVIADNQLSLLHRGIGHPVTAPPT